MIKIFYVYEWFNIKTLEVIYVGKGHGTRRFVTHRNNLFNKEIKENECKPRIVEFFENELDAFNFEEDRISELKNIGQAKCNIALGRGGLSTDFVTNEFRKKCSLSGDKNPRYNVKLDKETKQKISNSLKGKMSGDKNPFYGKHHNKKTVEKILSKRNKKIYCKLPNNKTKEDYSTEILNFIYNEYNIKISLPTLLKIVKKNEPYKSRNYKILNGMEVRYIQ